MNDRRQNYTPIVAPVAPSFGATLRHTARQSAIFTLEMLASAQVATRNSTVAPAEILFLTAFDDRIASFADPIVRHNETYARRHGYSFHVQRDGFDSTLPQSWSKIIFILDRLAAYRWIFWCDADALVIDHRVRLEGFLDPAADLIFGESVSPMLHLNCGCFFVQATIFSRLFLRSIWRQARFFSAHHWFEQAAVNHAYLRFRFRRLKVVPNRLFNAIAGPHNYHPESYFQAGDFIAHFAGQSEKSALLTQFEQKIIN